MSVSITTVFPWVEPTRSRNGVLSDYLLKTKDCMWSVNPSGFSIQMGREIEPLCKKKSIDKTSLSWPEEKTNDHQCSHLHLHLTSYSTCDMLAQYRIDSLGRTMKIKREKLVEEICSSSTFCLMENSAHRASWSQLDLPK